MFRPLNSFVFTRNSWYNLNSQGQSGAKGANAANKNPERKPFCLLRLIEIILLVITAVRGQCYKLFNGRNLRIFVLRKSVCLWQAFPAEPNVCGQEICLMWST
jgi:hypothetical protein